MVQVIRASGRVITGKASTTGKATVHRVRSASDVETGEDGRVKRATTGEFLSAARRAGEETSRFIKAQRKELLEEQF